MIDPHALSEAFASRFGATPRLARAPGRVNLIGEHTDYNDGFVMPAAIGFHAWVAIAPHRENRLRVHSLQFGESVERSIGSLHHPRQNASQAHWSDYVFGVARCLQDSGVALTGADLLVDGDVPLGAGLSSSAALEAAVAVALCDAAGAMPDRTALAQLCQRAENEDVGMRCGIMDQFASVHGVEGHALLLDCRSLAFEAVPLQAGTGHVPRLVVCNSMIRHQHAGGEYNVRRRQCEQAVQDIATVHAHITSLRDVDSAMLEALWARMDPTVFARARHVVSENGRVLEAARCLRRADYEGVGRAMAASHRSLRDDYQVSCPELDALVDFAISIDGTYGARMTGGGFGGCTVNLVRDDCVGHFRSELARRYQRHTGHVPDILVCDCVQGAGILEYPGAAS